LKLINLIIFFYLNFFCLGVLAQTIAIINIQSLIDNNQQYINILKDIKNDQKKYSENFQIKENELKKLIKDINESELILNDDEINLKIDNYNKNLNDYTISIDNFNLHYQKQIIYIREIILKEIIILLEKYAIDNNTDLILDSTSYLIASNSLDITNIIENELSTKILKLEYINFEKN
tara:strand:- start:360 stop:893 length:534 start_codon:yes stop_codon:yes gene_type:complete